MKKVYFIGLDIAKNVFQVSMADKAGRQIANRKISRSNVLSFFANLEQCVVGLEACSTAHHWAREIGKLGHEVHLIQPIRAKAFLGNRNKTDAADARAICEALMHPGTRFVSIKTEAQQETDHLLAMRERLVGNRTQLVNQIRAFLAEHGIIIAQGRTKFETEFPGIISKYWDKFGDKLQITLTESFTELQALSKKIDYLDELIKKQAAEDEHCKKLMTVKGIGALTAMALVSHVGDASKFKNGRQMAAYLGITPKEYSSGGKQKLLGITKHGSRRVRMLLIIAARAAMTGLSRRRKDDDGHPVNLDNLEKWILKLKARIGTFKTAVALANKMARMSWALMVNREAYNPLKASSGVRDGD